MADIQHSVQIAAKPEALYTLVATAKGLGQWWATDITESAGAAELGFFYRLRLTVDEPSTLQPGVSATPFRRFLWG